MAKQLITADNLEQKVLEKITFNWKTMRRAFKGLDLDKTGYIAPHEFKHFLSTWGMNVDEKVFMDLFNKFDADGDGVLSYSDF